MRVVLDTNILVSGLLWSGAPQRVIRLATQGQIDLWASSAILQEFEQVLRYARLQRRMRSLNVAHDDLLAMARAIFTLTEPPGVEPVIMADPKDDMVLACALAAAAHYIVSGDRHLLDLGQWRGMQIVTVNEFLDREFPGDDT